MEIDLIEFYQTNANFYDYLNKYVAMHDLAITDAITHKAVMAVAEYYLEVENDRRNYYPCKAD